MISDVLSKTFSVDAGGEAVNLYGVDANDSEEAFVNVIPEVEETLVSFFVVSLVVSFGIFLGVSERTGILVESSPFIVVLLINGPIVVDFVSCSVIL